MRIQSVDPGKRELYRLYTTKGLSLAEVGESLGCSRQFVSRLMKRHGLKTRNQAAAARAKRRRQPSGYIS